MGCWQNLPSVDSLPRVWQGFGVKQKKISESRGGVFRLALEGLEPSHPRFPSVGELDPINQWLGQRKAEKGGRWQKSCVANFHLSCQLAVGLWVRALLNHMPMCAPF